MNTQTLTDQQEAMVQDMYTEYNPDYESMKIKVKERIEPIECPSGLQEMIDEVVSTWIDNYDLWMRVDNDPLMYTKEKRIQAGHYACVIAAMLTDLRKIQSTACTPNHLDRLINSTKGDGA